MYRSKTLSAEIFLQWCPQILKSLQPLEMAINRANEKNADMVLASDPDGDRGRCGCERS